jgi:hypothetical protein
MRIVEIREHEVIVVTFLGIDVSWIGPAFCFVAEDLVDGGLVVVGVIISAREVIPVVFLLGVFVPAAREVEAEPGVNFVGVGDGLVAVFLVDLLGFASLFVVGCCFVVEDWWVSLYDRESLRTRELITSVPIDAEPDLVCLAHQGEKFFLGSPFCTLAPFLIEFPQVVQVVDVVTVAGGR